MFRFLFCLYFLVYIDIAYCESPDSVLNNCNDTKSCKKVMLDAAEAKDLQLTNNVIEKLNTFTKPARGDRKAARKLNEDGLLALNSNKTIDAVYLFNKAYEADPLDEEIFTNLLYALLKIENYSKVNELIDNGILLNAKRSNLWYISSISNLKSGNIKDGINGLWLSYQFSGDKIKMLSLLDKAINDQANQAIKHHLEKSKSSIISTPSYSSINDGEIENTNIVNNQKNQDYANEVKTTNSIDENANKIDTDQNYTTLFSKALATSLKEGSINYMAVSQCDVAWGYVFSAPSNEIQTQINRCKKELEEAYTTEIKRQTYNPINCSQYALKNGVSLRDLKSGTKASIFKENTEKPVLYAGVIMSEDRDTLTLQNQPNEFQIRISALDGKIPANDNFFLKHNDATKIFNPESISIGSKLFGYGITTDKVKAILTNGQETVVPVITALCIQNAKS